MRAFIVRPFGEKKDLKGNLINFDLIESELIGPALDKLGITGRTTGEILGQGNIRTDMFQLLLVADLVIADLSIHNANVFYEIGVRHALRDRHTFLLRSNADAFPFDLQTDRYFTYDNSAPAKSVDALWAALRETIDSGKTNSPIFAALPNMIEQDPSRFLVVPPGFVEDVDRAAAAEQLGDLGLLAAEAKGFSWETEGRRVVGRAQYSLKDFAGAKNSWESVRRIKPNDLEANLLLGTIFQRLGRLTESNQALDRALSNKQLTPDQKAEAYALYGRNSKTLWRQEWEGKADIPQRASVALRSGLLQESMEKYERGFNEYLNHFYSGLNALAMQTIETNLADDHKGVWEGRFKTRQKAQGELDELKERSAKLAAAVEVSLAASVRALERENKKDIWVEISEADLRFLTSDNPEWVLSAYVDALSGATEQAKDSVRSQLRIYQALGILRENTDKVIDYLGLPPVADVTKKRKRVLIFTGHMIDAADRTSPRFPASMETVAREKIKEAVQVEMTLGAGISFGIAGGASGGDILFHEVCDELNVPTQLSLALPKGLYVKNSVQPAGPDWVERFRQLYEQRDEQKRVRFLTELDEEPKDKSEYLPAWLRSKSNYDIWQRNNLWTLSTALAAAEDELVTLIALWDGEPTGDGPGGTSDLVKRVQNRGAKAVIIDTRTIFGL